MRLLAIISLYVCIFLEVHSDSSCLFPRFTDLMRRQEELRRLEELRNQELQRRKQIEMRCVFFVFFNHGSCLVRLTQSNTALFVVCYKTHLVTVILVCPFFAPVDFDWRIFALCRHEEERRRREEEMMRHREQEDLRRHTEGFKPNYMDNVSTQTLVHNGVKTYCTLI